MTRAHAHTRAHVHTHTHTYIYTHTHAYTHALGFLQKRGKESGKGNKDKKTNTQKLGQARTRGPCKHNTRARRHGLSAKRNRLTNAQTSAKYEQAGSKHAHTKGTFSASTQAIAPNVLLLRFLVRAGGTAPASSSLDLAWCIDESAGLHTCRVPPLPCDARSMLAG